jgi:hypothetical protein
MKMKSMRRDEINHTCDVVSSTENKIHTFSQVHIQNLLDDESFGDPFQSRLQGFLSFHHIQCWVLCSQLLCLYFDFLNKINLTLHHQRCTYIEDWFVVFFSTTTIMKSNRTSFRIRESTSQIEYH